MLTGIARLWYNGSRKVGMENFNERKPIIGIVGDTMEQAEWFARNLGGVKVSDQNSRILYASEKMVFDCRRYNYKGGTPRWNGIIFACDKSADSEKTSDWLNSLL